METKTFSFEYTDEDSVIEVLNNFLAENNFKLAVLSVNQLIEIERMANKLQGSNH